MRVTNYVVTASMGQIERFSTVSHFMIVEKLKTVLSFHIGENLGTVSYPTDIEKVMAVGIFNCCRCLTYHLVPASLFFEELFLMQQNSQQDYTLLQPEAKGKVEILSEIEFQEKLYLAEGKTFMMATEKRNERHRNGNGIHCNAGYSGRNDNWNGCPREGYRIRHPA